MRDYRRYFTFWGKKFFLGSIAWAVLVVVGFEKTRQNHWPRGGLWMAMNAHAACGCTQRKADIAFDFPARLDEIEPVVTAITQFATQQLPGESEKHLQIELALQEALANAVVHGCNVDPAKRVRCWAAYDAANGLLIVV